MQSCRRRSSASPALSSLLCTLRLAACMPQHAHALTACSAVQASTSGEEERRASGNFSEGSNDVASSLGLWNGQQAITVLGRAYNYPSYAAGWYGLHTHLASSLRKWQLCPVQELALQQETHTPSALL